MNCYYSKFKVWLTGAPWLALCCICAAFLVSPHYHGDKSGFWFGIILSGIAFIALIRPLFKNEPIIVIGKNGIEDFRSKFGLISWTDISFVKVRVLQSGQIGVSLPLLWLGIKEPNKYLAKLHTAALSINSEININFDRLTPDIYEAYEYIKSNHPDKIVEEK